MPSWKNSKNGDSDGWNNFSFLPKEVLFVMSIGYSNETERAEYKNKYEYKPSKNNIIKWL